MMESAQQKHTPIAFQGKLSEYFGIWIVNLLLTIVTLGIYSAWAKVRRKKYFYQNTLIENVGFDYHANPISILKGRAIAFVFFLGYAFGGDISPLLPAIFFLILLIALPWLVVRSATFNARNTSHRGLRFNFVGKLGEAARVFIVIPLLTLFSLGLAVPFASHQKNEFLMGRHRFGLSQFNMDAKIKDFYMVYLKFIGIILLIGILLGVLFGALKSFAGDTSLSPQQAEVVENEPPPSEHDLEVIQREMIAAQARKAEASKEASKTLEQKMAERQKKRDEQMREILKNPGYFLPFFLIGLAFYGLIIFSFLAYMQARIGNLVWNNTTLDKLSFKSTLRARDLLWLYFSNIVAIVFTVGLATPWAQLRLAKYRMSKLQIVGDVDFDQFVGDKKEEIKATGEEIAEMFDVDLSFG